MLVVAIIGTYFLESGQFISGHITEEDDILLSASLKRKFIISKDNTQANVWQNTMFLFPHPCRAQ